MSTGFPSGQTFTDADRQAVVKGADELTLVNSGLEETMIGAYRELRAARQRHAGIGDLRTAAFLVAMSGLQVAVVAPTTLLARQHFQTFSERLAGWPIKVRQLSRVSQDHDDAGGSHVRTTQRLATRAISKSPARWSGQ